MSVMSKVRPGKGPRGGKLKSHISETMWSTEINFCMAMNWIKVFMRKILSKAMISTWNIFGGCFGIE